MNAPAKITPARDRYLPIVKHHLPACEGTELTLRCSLLLMRDNATSNLRRCSAASAGVLSEVERLATLYAYAPMPNEQLAELRYQLLRLTAAASGLEQFAYRLSGGTNEGV